MKTFLVFGSRDFSAAKVVRETLDLAHGNAPIGRIIEGGAKGADRLGSVWATLNKVPCTEVPADWDRYGKSAGYRRNEEMVAMKPDFAIGFLAGATAGSMHTVRLCIEEGVPLFVVRTDGQVLKRPKTVAEVEAWLAYSG